MGHFSILFHFSTAQMRSIGKDFSDLSVVSKHTSADFFLHLLILVAPAFSHSCLLLNCSSLKSIQPRKRIGIGPETTSVLCHSISGVEGVTCHDVSNCSIIKHDCGTCAKIHSSRVLELSSRMLSPYCLILSPSSMVVSASFNKINMRLIVHQTCLPFSAAGAHWESPKSTFV